MFSCTNHRYASQEQNRVNKEITEQLKEEKRQVANQETVLVLGGKGSGKTTLIKLTDLLFKGVALTYVVYFDLRPRSK